MINDEDFGRLRLKIHNLKDDTDIVKLYEKQINEYYPSVKTFIEKSKKKKDINRVLKYIVYMFDKNSPMLHYFPDVGRRMAECARLAGYGRGLDVTDNSKLYSLEYGEYREIEGYERKNGKDKPIYSPPRYPMIDIVVEYCKEQNSKKWSMIVQDEMLFYENMREILLPITSFKDQKQKLDAVMVKSKLREENKKIDAESDGLYGEVFGNNDKVIAAARIKATTPERRHRKTRR